MNNLILPEDMVYVPKGWGSETWICNNELYCGKILHFDLGKRCSWHYHEIKDEVLFLRKGQIVLKLSFEDDLDLAETIIMIPGMAYRVTPGLRHQMIAEEESEIYEFSTFHDDCDSIRIIKGD